MKKQRLFSYDFNSKLIQCWDELKRPNGIAITATAPDTNNRLFVAESRSRRVLYYEILPTGGLGPAQVFAGNLKTPLDGMAVRPNGDLFVTSKNKILAFDSTSKKLIGEIDIFKKKHKVTPSNLCFLDNNCLAVTSYNLRGTAKLFAVKI